MNENISEIFPTDPELVLQRAELAARFAAEKFDPDLEVTSKLSDDSSKTISAPNVLHLRFIKNLIQILLLV